MFPEAQGPGQNALLAIYDGTNLGLLSAQSPYPNTGVGIFVGGRPKLADMGLIAEIRPADQKKTYVGTPGYMPPPPESPGTPQADIYALGMMLYVLSTGRNPTFFPEISTTLADSTGLADFFPLNSVILRACQPDCAQRYATAAEMHSALVEAQKALKGESLGAVSGAPH